MDAATSSDTPVHTASCLRRLDSSIYDLCNRFRAVTGVIRVSCMLCAGKQCPLEWTYCRNCCAVCLVAATQDWCCCLSVGGRGAGLSRPE